MRGRVRWRRPGIEELPTLERRLAEWPADIGGNLRHMFVLACMETSRVDMLRVATDRRDDWALVLIHPGRLLVACGDPNVIRAAGVPSRRWRLMVGDAAASDAIIEVMGSSDGLKVHHQRLLVVDPALVPTADRLPDPGVRPATREDLPGLADLAVQLHVDDEFGPDPGARGRKSYADRLARSVTAGLVWVVGAPGRPVMKVERAVSSRRWGVQLAGIVVTPEHRGSGLGSAAVAAMVRDALTRHERRPVTLHVRAANTPAIRAYERAGFEDAEEWRLVLRD